MRTYKDNNLRDKWKKALEKKNELLDMLDNGASTDELNTKGYFFSSPKNDISLR